MLYFFLSRQLSCFFYPVKPVHVSMVLFDLSEQTDAKLGHK